MSQHHQTHKKAALNPNLVAFIFIINFAVIGGLIVANVPVTAPDSEGDEPSEVILMAPTDTLVPSVTVTPLPPTATPTQPPTEQPTATSTPQVTADSDPATTAASGGYDPSLVERGTTLYAQCAACHGPDGHGIPNLGKDLVESPFVASLTDEALLSFIKVGRPIWDPENTTGIDMPGKGGNPALTDGDIMAIIAYLRSLAAGSGG